MEPLFAPSGLRCLVKVGGIVLGKVKMKVLGFRRAGGLMIFTGRRVESRNPSIEGKGEPCRFGAVTKESVPKTCGDCCED